MGIFKLTQRKKQKRKITECNKLKAKYHKYSTANLLKIPAYNAIMYGVAHVPEGRQVFANLTVQENLEMGAYKRHNTTKIKEDLKDLPKVIFLDEASRYDYVKMKLLSEAA